MKFPTMTKPVHWLALFALMSLEAVVAFVFFAYSSLPFMGLVMVILANLEFVGAVIAGVIHSTKSTPRR